MSRTLGAGSFGKVKLGVHTTGLEVAVKIFPKERIRNKKMEARIRREIQIPKLFRHPHIVRLYEVIETENDIYLVMEYMEGELFDYIVDRGRLEEGEARKFFQQIIGGVEYCHKHMVVHRDLKPENLLLDREDNVKIADFGLSNIMSDGSFLKSSVGSPNYAAPEVISGQLYVGPEVDIWSCGVILFALLCGKLPFDEEQISVLFRQIRNANYKIPRFVSRGARDLIKKILVVDPMKRATIADIRKHPWFKIGLPKYLSIPPMISRKGEITIDFEVLDEAIKKFTFKGKKEKAVAEIKGGKMSGIAVAYFLILDHKEKKRLRTQQREGGKGKGLDEEDILEYYPELAQSPPGGSSFSFQDFMLQSRTSGENTPLSSSFTRMNNFSIETHKVHTDSGWKVGFETTFPPNQVMEHIYNVLEDMNMIWKVEGHYHIQITPKIKINDEEKEEEKQEGKEEKEKDKDIFSNLDFVVNIQIFRKNDGAYLVDLAMNKGNMFHFVKFSRDFNKKILPLIGE